MKFNKITTFVVLILVLVEDGFREFRFLTLGDAKAAS